MASPHYRYVVVPLDGSPHAEHALPLALSIASRNEAHVRLVYVHQLLDAAGDPWRFFYESTFSEQSKRRQEKYLHAVVQRIEQYAHQLVGAVTVDGSNVARSLCSVASRRDHLVVMASRRRPLLGRMRWGSVADALLSRLEAPLLLVRGYDSPVDLTGDPVPKRILLPLDGLRPAESILAPAAQLAEGIQARCTLLSLSQGASEFTFRRGADDRAQSLHQYLQSTAADLSDRLPEVQTAIINGSGSAAKAILSYAAHDQSDLIGLVTSPRRGIRGLLHRSVARQVIQQARVPILLARPHA